MARSGGVSYGVLYFSSAGEFDAFDELGQPISSLQSAPGPGYRHDELEYHDECGPVAQAAFRPHRPVAHGCEHTFDRIRSSIPKRILKRRRVGFAVP